MTEDTLNLIDETIKDAVIHRDRCVNIFIYKDSITMNIYPYNDGLPKWKISKDGRNTECPNCGGLSNRMTPFCPECGEQLGKNDSDGSRWLE